MDSLSEVKKWQWPEENGTSAAGKANLSRKLKDEICASQLFVSKKCQKLQILL